MKFLTTVSVFSLFVINVSFGQMPSEHIYKVVEELPSYSDCEGYADRNKKQSCSDQKVNEYIYKNLKYPAIARENGVQGSVQVSFIVEKDGSTSNHKIIRNIGAACGDEAVRLIQKMEKWSPAKNRGKAVRCELKQVVRFEIPVLVDQRIESEPNVESSSPNPPTSLPKKNEIFRIVEDMPRFPGCEEEEDIRERKDCSTKKQLKYVYGELKYPTEAKKNGIEGTVVVTYVVEKDGSITGAKIIRDVEMGCGDEALRIVNTMPNWIPGKQRGKAVRVQFNLPIRFQFDGGPEHYEKRKKRLRKERAERAERKRRKKLKENRN